MPRSASVSSQPVSAYTLGDAARILKVAPSRLRYWGRTSLVEPSEALDSQPAYGFSDLVSVRSLIGLLDSGVPLAHIRRSVAAVRKIMPEVERPVNELRLWIEGSDRVVVRHRGVLIEPGGQTVIDFSDDLGQPTNALAHLVVAKRGEENALETPAQLGRDAAREWFERGCELDSERTTCADAIEAYLRAIEIDPSYADAHCNLGSLYFNRNRRSTARACFERALELEPGHVEANLNIAIVLEDEGRDESALRHYRRALRSDPLYADTHVSLALLYEKLGLLRKARAHWLGYLRLEPSGAWGDVARSRLDS